MFKIIKLCILLSLTTLRAQVKGEMRACDIEGALWSEGQDSPIVHQRKAEYMAYNTVYRYINGQIDFIMKAGEQ